MSTRHRGFVSVPGVDLDVIGAEAVPTPNSSVSVALAEAEEAYFAERASASDDNEIFHKKIHLAIHKRELQQIDDLLKARKTFANRIYWMLVGWLGSVVLMLLASGAKYKGFELDVKVLLTLIAGTTINVIGIFAIVANFLFPKNKGDILFSLQSRTAEHSAAALASASTPKKTAGSVARMSAGRRKTKPAGPDE